MGDGATRRDERALLWLSPRVVLATVVLLTLLRAYIAATTELAKDEAYYVQWSYFLAPGYIDHPPAVAWLIALGRALLGDNSLGVRLGAVLSAPLVSLALWRTGVILFDRRAAALAVLWFNLTAAGAISFIVTPDTLSVVGWTLAIWTIAEFMSRRNAHWWLLAGLFAGLGLLSKLPNLFLAPGLALFLLTSAERRRWLGLWQVWVGAGLALLAASPMLWWNAVNGWLSFAYQADRLENPGGNVAEFLAGQALFMGPILAVLAVAAIATGWRVGREALALVALTAVPLLAYLLYHSLVARAEANWSLPVWPMLTLAAAAAAGNWFDRWWGRLLAQTQALYGIALTALISVQALIHPFESPVIDRTRELYGWSALQADIAELAESSGAEWIATRSDYALTGELFTYGRFGGSALPVIQIDQRDRYLAEPAPDRALLEQPALLVTEVGGPGVPPSPDDAFASSTLLQVVERRRDDEVLGYYAVFAVSEPRDSVMGVGR